MTRDQVPSISSVHTACITYGDVKNELLNLQVLQDEGIIVEERKEESHTTTMRCRDCSRTMRKPKGKTKELQLCYICRVDPKSELNEYFNKHTILANRPYWILPQEIVMRRMAYNLSDKWKGIDHC